MTPKEAFVQKVTDFLEYRIRGVIEWYTTGAVDCKETRTRINAELDGVLRETEEKFRLRPFARVLRVRIDSTGFFKVRWEERDLS